MSIHPLIPEEIWKHFHFLTTIPRGSFNTQALQDEIVKFGKKLELEVEKDEAGNVIIRKPASSTKEQSPSVCLQAHLDMVCEKESDHTFDFLKDSIQTIIVDGKDGPELKAVKTTLGADDGIGVATAMAILESKTLIHGALECLFTVDEEVGMVGARKLRPDFIKSGYLINLDSEEDWRICVGCAGAFNLEHVLPLSVLTETIKSEITTETHSVLSFSISKCRSGHSGCDIHLNRINPISALGRILDTALYPNNSSPSPSSASSPSLAVSPAYLLNANGGSKRNVIPAGAEFVLLVGKTREEVVRQAVQREFDAVKQEYLLEEPNMVLSIQTQPFPENSASTVVFDAVSTERLVKAVLIAPHGVLRMSPAVAGLVESSVNFFNVHLSTPTLSSRDTCLTCKQKEENQQQLSSSSSTSADDAVTSSSSFAAPPYAAHLGLFPRSSSNSQLAYIHTYLQAHASILGAVQTEKENFYYGWDPDTSPQNVLLQTAIKAFREAQQKEPEIYAVHAGLECGIIMGIYPKLKCISLGPYLTSPHTPEETLYLKSVIPFYNTLLKTLEYL